MIRKSFLCDGDSPRARVTFAIPDSVWADSIHLVGDFNDWNPRSHPLQRNRADEWSLTLDLAPGQSFQFRYLCDGERWLLEDRADGYVPNTRVGGYNGIVITDAAACDPEPLRP
jgi:1,4-alpha-glucan branching enzyme